MVGFGHVLFCALFLVSVARAQYGVTFYGNLTVKTRDGTPLVGNAYVPKPVVDNETFPVLIFPSSWATPSFEYILRTLNFAEKGYVAFEYEVRGWYRSGGLIDIIGRKDIEDAEDIVSWILSLGMQWNINMNKVAFVGISQGAGIALMAAGHDVRVTTAVSMSGWNNLSMMAYDHETPNLVWGGLLEVLADLVGHPGPDLGQLLADLLEHKNMTWVRSYLEERSPQRYVNTQYNPRAVPLFLSNNFLDRLFKPQHIIEFFESLTTGPKFLLLNQGIHAQAELTGLIMGDNYIWSKARRWLDYFLKGIPTGILDEAPVQMQLAGGVSDYQLFNHWPPTSADGVIRETFYLTPRGSKAFGTLTRQGPFSHAKNRRLGGAAAAHTPDVISFSTSPGIGDGIPVVSDLTGPVTVDLATVPTAAALIYVGDTTFEFNNRLCTTPRISLTFRPAAPGTASAAHWWQVYFFLYAVNSQNVAQLLSDGPFTHYDDREVQADPVTGIVNIVNASFHTICVQVPAGNRLGLGVALYNELYSPINTTLTVEMLYGEGSFIQIDRIPR